MCVVLIAIGVARVRRSGLASDPATAWRAFHVNYLYFGTHRAGRPSCVACAFVIIGARWPGPVRRIAEALGAWAPITFVLFLVATSSAASTSTPWLHAPPPGKEASSTRRVLL